MVDDGGDGVGDHAHVVDGEVAVAADAEQAAHVGGADADGQNAVTVSAQHLAQGGQFLVARLAVDHLGRLHHRHDPERYAELLGTVGDRGEERLADGGTDLGQHETGG